MNNVHSPSQSILETAASLLKSGQVVAIPTETVYGLAALINSPDGIERIFTTKERPHFDPLIVHISHLDQLQELISPVFLKSKAYPLFLKLTLKFWPGPLTCILPKNDKVSDMITSGLPSVGIRMPSHPVALQLLSQTGPLAAPSANKFGRISPTTAQAVYNEFLDTIPLILDGGMAEVGVESTVIDFSSETFQILRPGSITAEQIEVETGINPELAFLKKNHSYLPENKQIFSSPGMLKSHYAPRTPLHLISQQTWNNQQNLKELLLKIVSEKKVCFLFQNNQQKTDLQKILGENLSQFRNEVLSPTDDLSEKARTLFEKLRILDTSKNDLILALPLPSQSGLGYAIADRLKKASSLEL